MVTWDITGTWIGEYRYDPSPAIPELPAPTRFTLEAHRGALGRVRGTIQDDPARGAFEPATMVGRVCGATVWFRKQYPRYYVYDRGQLTTLEEQLEAEQGITLNESPAGRPIWYRGRYDEECDSVAGMWRIKRRLMFFKARGRLHVTLVGGVRGTWHMQRQAV